MIAGALFSFDLLSTVRFDKRSFQNCLKTGKLYVFRQLTIGVDNLIFQSCLKKAERRYASCQLLEQATVVFRVI